MLNIYISETEKKVIKRLANYKNKVVYRQKHPDKYYVINDNKI